MGSNHPAGWWLNPFWPGSVARVRINSSASDHHAVNRDGTFKSPSGHCTVLCYTFLYLVCIVSVMTTLFPSIIPGEDFVDDSYSKSELTDKDWNELRSIAKEHPKETVDGKTDKETIIDELAGEKRV